MDHAFATAQAIYDAFEARGHRVCLAPLGSSYRRPAVDPRENPGTGHYFGPSWSPSRETVVFVGTLAIGLSLFELSERVEMVYRNGRKIRLDDSSTPRRGYGLAGYTTHDDLPTGRLCLRAYCPYGYASWTKEWRESEAGDLKERAKRIARQICREAPALLVLIEDGKRRAELEYQRWEEERRQWARQESERKRAKALEESRSELLAAISGWGEANRIERFFQDVEARLSRLPDQKERKEVLERLRLGREMVGSIDALEHFRAWKAPTEREVE